MPRPHGDDSVDPAWSSDGSLLAFAEAPNSQDPAYFASDTEHWYDAHELWLYSTNSGAYRAIAVAKGAIVPVWSDSGHALLYVSDDGIWLFRGAGTRPVRVAYPLLQANDWAQGDYFGQIPGSDQFSWRSK
jgi:dipeptidyl aminopeptidase/acylaminoacyl peptidase